MILGFSSPLTFSPAQGYDAEVPIKT